MLLRSTVAAVVSSALEGIGVGTEFVALAAIAAATAATLKRWLGLGVGVVLSAAVEQTASKEVDTLLADVQVEESACSEEAASFAEDKPSPVVFTSGLSAAAA